MTTEPMTAERALAAIPRAAEVKANAVREATNRLLAECTAEQVAFFHRVHSNAQYKSWENCPDDLLDGAHDLAARTVEFNRGGRP